MAVPNITWYIAPDGSCKVFMHEGLIIRSFDAANVAAAERAISAVCIDAFRMPQPDAMTFAESAVADQVKAAALPQTLSDHIALLQEQLTESQAEAAELRRAATDTHKTPEQTEGASPVASNGTGAAAASAALQTGVASALASPVLTGAVVSPAKFTSSEIGHG
jgi:hypothetical protein